MKIEEIVSQIIDVINRRLRVEDGFIADTSTVNNILAEELQKLITSGQVDLMVKHDPDVPDRLLVDVVIETERPTEDATLFVNISTQPTDKSEIKKWPDELG